MKFAVEVGDVEKNHLEYHANQLLGSQTIKINNRPVKRVVHLVNEPIFEVHSFVVGFNEKTTVRIEKQRLSYQSLAAPIDAPWRRSATCLLYPV